MHILTFDIEDWFHILDNDSTRGERQWRQFESRIEENTDRILAILEEKRVRATFFCLGWIADRHPEVIRKISDFGLEVACHSYAHKLVYEMSPAEFVEDLKRSIGVLEDLTGRRVRAYRAPGFSFKPKNVWAFDALLKEGIEIDCSIFPAFRSHGGFATFGSARPVIVRSRDGTLKEFPINVKVFFLTNVVFAGGGYFRFFPYKIIKKWTREAPYLMSYFHPRDFDPAQPVIGDLGWVRKFRAYCGLRGAEAKLRRFLDDFTFLDLAQADAKIDWSTVETVDIHERE